MLSVLSSVVSNDMLKNKNKKAFEKKGLIYTNYKNIKSNEEYQIIRYDKNYMARDMVESTGLFRSVIVKNSKIICYSPPKSISMNTFTNNYIEKSEYVIAEELVEGTMINLFWDETLLENTGAWECATRSTVGAYNYFWQSTEKDDESLTFRRMFLDTAIKCNFEFDKLDKKCCYSFVLQHPNNKIVLPIKEKQLYLVACYEINHDNDSESISIRYKDPHKVIKSNEFSETTVKVPKIIDDWESCEELKSKYKIGNIGYDNLGVVIKNTLNGQRTKFRNPVYEEIHLLRGNNAKIQYQYLILRQDAKVGDYLKYFPESKSEFNVFKDQVHLFTRTLYENYIN